MHENKQPEQGPKVGRRRRRLLAHLGIFAAAGLAMVTLGPSSTSAGSPPGGQEGKYLTAGNLQADYLCEGADAGSKAILGGILPSPPAPAAGQFLLPTTILSDAVEPSPAQGDDFDMTFTFNFVLPKNLTEVAVETGYTELVVTGGGAISPTEGAVGETAILTDTVTVQLGDGSVAVGFTIGPQSFPYTRTAAPGEPIVFTPNQILSETPIVTGLLKMICYPPDEELILNDQIGVAPIATTTTLQALVPTTAGPPATVKGTTDDAEVAALPRTGSGTSNLYLVLLALGLLDVGYLALTADNSRTRRASSVR